jgi:hypothetical protein
VVSAPNGSRENHRVANEEDRNNRKLKELMAKHPDWNWDYWLCQFEKGYVSEGED